MAKFTEAMAEQSAPAKPEREYAGWLIKKYNHYYRPNWSGYTDNPAEAGRYTLSQAKREAAIEPGNFKIVRAPEVPPRVADIVANCREALRPYDFAVVPRELTAENGMKYALIGELSLRATCEERDEFGDERIVDFRLSWDDIKRLWREMLARAEEVEP